MIYLSDTCMYISKLLIIYRQLVFIDSRADITVAIAHIN